MTGAMETINASSASKLLTSGESLMQLVTMAKTTSELSKGVPALALRWTSSAMLATLGSLARQLVP